MLKWNNFLLHGQKNQYNISIAIESEFCVFKHTKPAWCISYLHYKHWLNAIHASEIQMGSLRWNGRKPLSEQKGPQWLLRPGTLTTCAAINYHIWGRIYGPFAPLETWTFKGKYCVSKQKENHLLPWWLYNHITHCELFKDS